MKRLFLLISILLLIEIFSVRVFSGIQEDFKKGEIISRVECRDKPGQSYALFLPIDYNPEKKWPILFAFDPGARGRLPLQNFQAAAEKFQYIIIGSNNARNGPWEPVFEAMAAIWNDVIVRFSIDPQRIYVTGFSGGARAAAYFPKIVRIPIRGIIGCGAGLPSGMKAEEIKPSFYFGVVGNEDFNYIEMKTLDKQLDESDVAHRFLEFAGSHDWPPPDVCQRVLGWMEILGMVQKLRAPDKGMIDDIFNTEVQAARALEESGRIFLAVQEYETINSAFQTLRDTNALKVKEDQLKKSSKFENLHEQVNKKIQKELYNFNHYRSLLSQIEKEIPPLHLWHQLFRNLGVNEWQKILQQKQDKEEMALAARQLSGLESDAQNKGWFFLDKGDFSKAILFFEIAVRANTQAESRLRYLYYYLASAYALGRDSKQAIKNLNLAVENGFDDGSMLEKSDSFASIKQSPEYQKIAQTLKQEETNISIRHNLQKFLIGQLPPDELEITYHDIHGLWGGLQITIHGSGKVEQTVVQTEAGVPHDLVQNELHRLIKLIIELEGWIQKVPDREPVPDESRALLRIRAGDKTSDIWEWFNDMSSNNRLSRILDLMKKLCWQKK